MNSNPGFHPRRSGSAGEIKQLRAKLAEAVAVIKAIRSGEVDAVVVASKGGPRVFTLEGADHAYRILMESMHEGALTLSTKGAILFTNRCFASLVKSPPEQVVGSSFLRFLAAPDRKFIRQILNDRKEAGAKLQVGLLAGKNGVTPVQLSLLPLAQASSKHATFGVVVTDLTEVRRSEERLRALIQRVVEVQETERGRVALELHDHVTQLLCGVLVRSQVLADQLPEDNASARREAIQLRDLLGETANEVERISRELRPGVLEQLGLLAVLRQLAREFPRRTGVALKVDCQPLATRLPADIELALYRIIHEALRNVELHAHAQKVTLQLKRTADFIRLKIQDNGAGFDLTRHPNGRPRKSGLGLLSMSERASHVGGTLKLTSGRGTGTEIVVQIPLPAGVPSGGMPAA